MYIQYHILGCHVILMLCLNLMLGPTYLPYFFWQQTGTTHIFHLGLSNCKQRIVSLSLLVGTTVVTFVFSIVLYDWNLNFSRMNASLECMIFFIWISRNYVVSIKSVFLFLVLSVCWLRYLIVTNRGPSIIIYANRRIALAQYIVEVYDTCELDLVKKSSLH